MRNPYNREVSLLFQRDNERKERKMLTLTKEEINEMVDSSETTVEALVKLYKRAIPEYSTLEKIEGYPKVSRITHEYIVDKLMEKFDSMEIFFIWLNKGFSYSLEIPDWCIDTSECKLIKKGGEIIFNNNETVLR